MCVPRGQKRVSYPLELKLQMAVSCHVCAEPSIRTASIHLGMVTCAFNPSTQEAEAGDF
ncbi:hypothetical protein I79_003418 [Cricetulus griseus]|uniref:Uncharacterized protein n=1 Tax=Cricetulus griseus TaxID=10029 RepID=G3GZX0_CRIGR|nr:hypothetical protein I79_003418 [Cricetulus griseus]